MEEGAPAGSPTEDDFNSLGIDWGDFVDDSLSNLGSDVDGEKEQNQKQGFSTKNGVEI